MLRWLTAGESHGAALVGVLDGLPAAVEVTTDDVRLALARRRLGYGRGARMKFEQDEVTFLGGVRHGRTQGGPVAVQIGNTEWPKWETVMAADPVPPEGLPEQAAGGALTRPRPGHADLVGMQKYGFDDARPPIRRASARETAARVALGARAAPAAPGGHPAGPAAGCRGPPGQARRRRRARPGCRGRAASSAPVGRR